MPKANPTILDTDGEPLVVAEKTTCVITAQLVDALGAPIAGGALNTLTLTLHVDDAQKTIVNTVDHVSILNTGRGAIDSLGHLTLSLTGPDSTIMDTSVIEERHVLLLEWTYNGGQAQGHQALMYRVRNLARLT